MSTLRWFVSIVLQSMSLFDVSRSGFAK